VHRLETEEEEGGTSSWKEESHQRIQIRECHLLDFCFKKISLTMTWGTFWLSQIFWGLKAI
jgi:hypothetical protein